MSRLKEKALPTSLQCILYFFHVVRGHKNLKKNKTFLIELYPRWTDLTMYVSITNKERNYPAQNLVELYQ